MKEKYIIALSIFFLVIFSFFGCNNFLGDSSQTELIIGVEQSLDNNAPFTVLNEPEYHRFSVVYSNKKNTNNQSAFFSFEINSDSDENESWSSYHDANDNSMFSFKDGNGNSIAFNNGSHDFFGKKTIYIYYDSAPERVKNFCENFPGEQGNSGDSYSIYINGEYLAD